MAVNNKEPMAIAPAVRWTNKSVRAFAKNADPLDAIQDAARSLVLKARESGWQGPPFNPLYIAEMLNVQLEANASISDARLVLTNMGAKIEFNPQQPRERVRFSIAHEVAHLLFPDWHERIRNRGRRGSQSDDWQLEMLCNLAASEFVLPIGSLLPTAEVPPIEDLMNQRRDYDVSAEAFLIRLTKISIQPIGVFFASPVVTESGARSYRVDYWVSSPTAPHSCRPGKDVPTSSVVQTCTAIGYTDRAIESWITGFDTQVECVGISAYPGALYPRVAGLVRFEKQNADRHPISVVHGSVLDPRGDGPRIICQLVNDRATKWGGGVARKVAGRYPAAEKEFTEKIFALTPERRLGAVIFTYAGEDISVASLVAQEGFGPSLFPRIRYSALKQCFEVLAEKAGQMNASIHMPRIGAGSAGGDWGTIEEMLDDIMVRAGLTVIIYDLPPRRQQLELF